MTPPTQITILCYKLVPIYKKFEPLSCLNEAISYLGLLDGLRVTWVQNSTVNPFKIPV